MMSEAEVVALMESSKNEDEWNANCDAVKADVKATTGRSNYPAFWFSAILASGLADRVVKSWTNSGAA